MLGRCTKLELKFNVINCPLQDCEILLPLARASSFKKSLAFYPRIPSTPRVNFFLLISLLLCKLGGPRDRPLGTCEDFRESEFEAAQRTIRTPLLPLARWLPPDFFNNFDTRQLNLLLDALCQSRAGCNVECSHFCFHVF